MGCSTRRRSLRGLARLGVGHRPRARVLDRLAALGDRPMGGRRRRGRLGPLRPGRLRRGAHLTGRRVLRLARGAGLVRRLCVLLGVAARRVLRFGRLGGGLGGLRPPWAVCSAWRSPWAVCSAWRPPWAVCSAWRPPWRFGRRGGLRGRLGLLAGLPGRRVIRLGLVAPARGLAGVVTFGAGRRGPRAPRRRRLACERERPRVGHPLRRGCVRRSRRGALSRHGRGAGSLRPGALDEARGERSPGRGDRGRRDHGEL